MVGESGAGKSLTGLAIIGLLEPPGPHRSGGESLSSHGRADRHPAAASRMRADPRRQVGSAPSSRTR